VAWYQKALARSDYAEAVLGAVDSLIGECEDALDIGAGCGALAIPLARRMTRVTAVEPAPAMAQALRREALRRGLKNLTILDAAWGEISLHPHDLVLCAHVGGLLDGDSPFLAQVSALARRAVVLVRDAGADQDKFFFKELYPVLLGRPYGSCCDFAETVTALERQGIRPSVTFVDYRSDQPFDDLEEVCDFWMEYLGVVGEDVRGFLREFLSARLRRNGSGWVAPYPKRAAAIWWRVSSSGLHSASESVG
jgi:SAM-dependent methyltransferase